MRKRENEIDLWNQLRNLNIMETGKLEELKSKTSCEINKILVKKKKKMN